MRPVRWPARLGLGKLIGFYDHNGISIDGKTEGWFSDDTAERFRAYHWHVIGDIDGHDPQAIKQAITEAQAVKDKPSLIICRTIIGSVRPTKRLRGVSRGGAGRKRGSAGPPAAWLEISSVRDPERDLRGLGCASARGKSGARLEREIRRLPAAVPGAGR
ncbi:transketolase [Klebsiella pneumoniae]|uniref:Transketolase n=1 Tax=Klebsiella pneumoniae TaxID=573 RepID=A0A377WPR8_KLEPN|nr:transketolase [Klebsiella pneumoniae]